MIKGQERLIYIASIIVLAILLLRDCSGDTDYSTMKPFRTTKVEMKYVSLPKKEAEIQYVPVPYFTYTITPEDTAGQLEDLLKIRMYKDTFAIDTNLTVYTKDSVVGKILKKNFSYSYRPFYKEVTTTHTDSIPYAVPIVKRGLYVGGGFHYVGKNLYSNVGLRLVDKRDNMYGIGIDPLNYVNNKEFSIFIDYHRRLKIKK
jgi:hypothetical protein